MGHLEEGKSTYLGEGHRKEEDSISRNFTLACAMAWWRPWKAAERTVGRFLNCRKLAGPAWWQLGFRLQKGHLCAIYVTIA